MRDFRTPFVVGALWATAAVLAAWYCYDGDLGRVDPATNVYEIVKRLPDVLQLGVLAFTIYLVGLVARGVQDWFPDWLGWERFAAKLPGPRQAPGSTAKDYLADAARERFANYPPAVREVARQILLDEYELADVILTSRSPEQYQEYDRRRSEAEFRNAIWFPLLLTGLGLGLVAGGLAAWLVTAGVCAASMMLKFQGIESRRQADQRLASAVYFDLASTPLFDALFSEMNRRTQERVDRGVKNSVTTSEQIAWVSDFLRVRGLDDVMRGPLLHTPERATLKAILNQVSWETYRYIRRSKRLQDLLLVAYGGIEWDKENGTLANRTVDVDRVIAAHDRLSRDIEFGIDEGDFDSDHLAVTGALRAARNNISTLQGGATDDEWRIAVRIEDSRNSMYARQPETAFEPD